MTLQQKIEAKKIRVGIIGLGYVGLPLAVEYASRGFATVGIDLDVAKVKAINAGRNYIADVDSNRLRKAVASGLLKAETTYNAVGKLDVLFICVPTPFTASKEPDISAILAASSQIAARLRNGQLVVVKSTTFPGTTEHYVLPLLEQSGLQVGRDFFLAFSPERIDPGNKTWTTANTPVVVGGVTKKCTRLAAQVSARVVSKVIPVSSPRVAEMEKLLENIFRSVNIALVNELAQLCERMGNINVWEVVEAAATKPFGFMPFYPGPGIGGHCILVDPYYLAWLARRYDFQTNFITLAAETNENMPFYVKNMVQRAVSMMPISLADARILILGVAFKKDVDDTRHSPALKIMELLHADGARNLAYHDPYVPAVTVGAKRYRSQPLTKAALRDADCILITTDHSSFDYETIVAESKLVIDTRNATKKVMKNRDRIVLLGDKKQTDG